MLVIVLNLDLNKKIAGRTGADGKKNVKIIVLLNYLGNFWRTLECH